MMNTLSKRAKLSVDKTCIYKNHRNYTIPMNLKNCSKIKKKRISSRSDIIVIHVEFWISYLRPSLSSKMFIHISSCKSLKATKIFFKAIKLFLVLHAFIIYIPERRKWISIPLYTQVASCLQWIGTNLIFPMNSLLFVFITTHTVYGKVHWYGLLNIVVI